MPIKPCRANGRSGHKWGGQGKCYTGKGSRAKASRQARAAHAAGYRGK